MEAIDVSEQGWQEAGLSVAGAEIYATLRGMRWPAAGRLRSDIRCGYSAWLMTVAVVGRLTFFG
jgi:hypothetical protein